MKKKKKARNIIKQYQAILIVLVAMRGNWFFSYFLLHCFGLLRINAKIKEDGTISRFFFSAIRRRRKLCRKSENQSSRSVSSKPMGSVLFFQLFRSLIQYDCERYPAKISITHLVFSKNWHAQLFPFAAWQSVLTFIRYSWFHRQEGLVFYCVKSTFGQLIE